MTMLTEADRESLINDPKPRAILKYERSDARVGWVMWTVLLAWVMSVLTVVGAIILGLFVLLLIWNALVSVFKWLRL